MVRGKSQLITRSPVFTGLLLTKLTFMKGTILFIISIGIVLNNLTAQVTIGKADSAFANKYILRLNSPRKNAKPYHFRTVCYASRDLVAPVYVIDGVIVTEFELKKLDPNNIDSIWLLKDCTATALFGCKAMAGVILITTKTANNRTIVVKDVLTYESLPAASIELIPIEKGNEPARFIADSFGKVVTNKIVHGKEYQLKVSRVGYKTYTAIVDARTVGVYFPVTLQRDYSELKEVVVGRVCHWICRRYIYCRKTKLTEIVKKHDAAVVKIYPNPVQRFQKINIELENKINEKLIVKLFSLDGRLVRSNEFGNKVDLVSFFLAQQVAAGIYSIQVFNENKHLLKTDKLVIQ